MFHAVRLDTDKCTGCINCIKHCPTGAIRIRAGKAKVLKELCIDCGECIRVCPTHAMRAVYDHLDVTEDYEYKIALLSPTIFGQIRNLEDLDYVMTAFKKIGFDDVFETSRAAELISEATRKYMNLGAYEYPVISSACPTVVKLIQLKFPDLCSHVLPIKSPMHIAAKMAREEAISKTGLDSEKIGVFYISPCTSEVTEAKNPIIDGDTDIDGVIGICEVYHQLVATMEKLEKVDAIANSGLIGVSWAIDGGESAALMSSHYLSAGGIENVMNVLEEIEEKKFKRLHFVELRACDAGCVGGILTVKNPFMAKARTQILRKYLPVSMNHLETDEIPKDMMFGATLNAVEGMKLSDNLFEALAIMQKIDGIEKKLPGLDCGACGSPSCKTFAEDVALGYSNENDCVFIMRDQVQHFAKQMSLLGMNLGENRADNNNLKESE
ncbi:MAG: 4Fe-4S binding protein [Clostridia bacterium]|nr:4Fe-4S binding protein [Clostridia bacterium]